MFDIGLKMGCKFSRMEIILFFWVVCVGKEESVKWRALTEEHARDSFENLLFSVCRFRELTGAYPQNITVCEHY